MGKKIKKDKKKRRPAALARQNLPRKFEEQLAEAGDLLDQRDYVGARDLLE